MSRTSAARPKYPSVNDSSTRRRKAPRGVGRPAKLTERMILDAAIDIGLDDFTIAGLAEHLGSGISAIYRVAHTRAHIVEKAAAFLASRFIPPRDTGQPWWMFVEEYCEYFYAILTEDKARAAYFMDGGFSARTQFNSFSEIYRGLLSRGLTSDEAYDAVQGATMIVGGATLSHMHMVGARADGIDHRLDTLGMLETDPFAQEPALQAILERFSDERRHTDWRHHLRLYLQGFAARHNKVLA